MAHYAFLNQNNIVIEVITGIDENASALHIMDNIRKQYAGIGYTYDPVNDVFIAPQPFPSWSLDENFDWQAPTPMPTESDWYWSEENGEWLEFIF
jgi:hypothetical protein